MRRNSEFETNAARRREDRAGAVSALLWCERTSTTALYRTVLDSVRKPVLGCRIALREEPSNGIGLQLEGAVAGVR